MKETEPLLQMNNYLPDAKGYAIISRGALAFRYGPYSMPELGEIMMRSLEDKTPVFVTVDCGAVPFDHEFAINMRGFEFEENDCPGHVASAHDNKVCGRCGTHIDSLRPDEEGEA